MTDIPATTTIVVQKHHLRWFFALTIIFVCAIGAAAFYFGGGNIERHGRHIDMTTPTLGTLASNIDVKQQPGGQTIVETQTTQPEAPASEQAATPAAQPAQNGKTQTTGDGFGPDHRLQRTVTDTDRYDPIEKVAEGVQSIRDSVKSLGDQMSSVEGQVKGIDGRVSALESKQATPAAAPSAPTPATPAAPATGPQSEVAPAPEASAPVAEATGPEPRVHEAANYSNDSGLNADETNFFVPRGIHLVDKGMAGERNLSKIRSCKPPHRVEIDRDSPKCHAAGYNDPRSGMPVTRCPNKCV